MASATLIRLNKDEWQKLPAGHFYNGKYQVGPFTITYEFIVKYMALIHKTEIPESWLTDNGTSLDECLLFMVSLHHFRTMTQKLQILKQR